MKKQFDLNLLNDYVANTAIVCEKHPDEDIYIYGYYQSNEMTDKISWDSVNIHCRGIILDSKGNVIERPFPKFWTFQQYITKDAILLNDDQVLRLPKSNYRITEKIDGTMVVLYWLNDKPYLATQRSFTNIKAKLATDILHKKYAHTFKTFNRNHTYIFEAVYPETKVLIDYGDTRDLFLIGVIDKKTGSSLPFEDIGFPKAKDYTARFGHLKNFDDLANLNLRNEEGFVIHYESGELVKIKFPWYRQAHQLLDKFFYSGKRNYSIQKELRRIFHKNQENYVITSLDIWECLKNKDVNLYSIRSKVNDYYYMFGLEYWLETHKENIITQYEKLKGRCQGQKDIWNEIKPVGEDLAVFYIDVREKSPHIYETIVWNWEKRLL
jgi:hypothetical protein